MRCQGRGVGGKLFRLGFGSDCLVLRSSLSR